MSQMSRLRCSSPPTSILMPITVRALGTVGFKTQMGMLTRRGKVAAERKTWSSSITSTRHWIHGLGGTES